MSYTRKALQKLLLSFTPCDIGNIHTKQCTAMANSFKIEKPPYFKRSSNPVVLWVSLMSSRSCDGLIWSYFPRRGCTVTLRCIEHLTSPTHRTSHLLLIWVHFPRPGCSYPELSEVFTSPAIPSYHKPASYERSRNHKKDSHHTYV